MNATQFLLKFADKIEQKEMVNQATAIKIKSYIRKLEETTPIEIFLIISGVMGALFCAAGIFSLIGHNWDIYPKHIRGGLSVIPVLIGLYFYYRAIFHHKESRPWIEVSSVFLMLMIGASIMLIGDTYQLEGDLNKFAKVWALLSLPLFYFARASGITVLYLGLILVLATNVSFGFLGIPSFAENENNSWYWLLLLGYLPHYYLTLNKGEGKTSDITAGFLRNYSLSFHESSRSQSIRVVFMSYIVYFSFMLALIFTIKGNFVLWIATASAGFYLIGKRFMGKNTTIFARPFQLLSQLGIVTLLFSLSNKDWLRSRLSDDSFVHLFKEDESPVSIYTSVVDSNEGAMFYFALALIVMSVVSFGYIYFRKQLKNVSKLVLFTPVFLMLMMICHEYLFPHWLVVMLINIYILLIGFDAMITGNENQNMAHMTVGFVIITGVFWLRYFDTDWNFFMKGLMYAGIGGFYFLLNLTQKSKIERIKRNKTRRDDY